MAAQGHCPFLCEFCDVICVSSVMSPGWAISHHITPIILRHMRTPCVASVVRVLVRSFQTAHTVRARAHTCHGPRVMLPHRIACGYVTPRYALVAVCLAGDGWSDSMASVSILPLLQMSQMMMLPEPHRRCFQQVGRYGYHLRPAHPPHRQRCHGNHTASVSLDH